MGKVLRIYVGPLILLVVSSKPVNMPTFAADVAPLIILNTAVRAASMVKAPLLLSNLIRVHSNSPQAVTFLSGVILVVKVAVLDMIKSTILGIHVFKKSA